MRLVIAAIALATACGCVHEVNIQTVKSWENHYMTVEAFKAGTENISLGKDETVWVLSNATLKRVLKNTERK